MQIELQIKRRRFTTAAALLSGMLLAGGLSSCTKQSDPLPHEQFVMIAPSATFTQGSVEAVTYAPQTKAPLDGTTQQLTLHFVRADQSAPDSYGSYGTTPFSATRTAGDGATALAFNPVQYYLTNGSLKTKMTGWYPAATAFSNGVVSWTFDGQQDIMTAAAREGSKTALMPSFAFEHRLTQLQFYPYAQTQSAIDAWGKITKIEVLNQQNRVVYDLANDATGAVSFSGDKINNFSAGIAAGGAALSLSTTANKATDAKQMGNAVMIAPQSAANHVLTLRITTEKNMYKDVTLTQALTAGVPYRLYMDFKELDIIIETAVAQWRDVATSDNIGGEIRIGDYMGGGLVYWIDPANSKKYKVMSLEESAITTWAASDDYAVSGARSDTDGKANSAAIKAAFDSGSAGIPITETDFAVAFPAAAYCYNYKGKAGTDAVGSWHLPAKSELQYLWCAYNGVAPISWESGTDAAAPEDPLAQEVWNNRIKAGGVTAGITRNYFWSSTESSSSPSHAWFVSLSIGGTNSHVKGGSYDVRCVKDI